MVVTSGAIDEHSLHVPLKMLDLGGGALLRDIFFWKSGPNKSV